MPVWVIFCRVIFLFSNKFTLFWFDHFPGCSSSSHGHDVHTLNSGILLLQALKMNHLGDSVHPPRSIVTPVKLNLMLQFWGSRYFMKSSQFQASFPANAASSSALVCRCCCTHYSLTSFLPFLWSLFMLLVLCVPFVFYQNLTDVMQC